MLKDVLEELAGTLVVHGMSGGLGQDVTLVWVFNNTFDEHQKSEAAWFVRNG
jgi:hypothetical protein